MKHWHNVVCALILGCSIAAQAKVVQQTDAMPAIVTDAYGKRVTQQIKLVYAYDDSTSSPRPVVVLNHGRSYKPETRSALEPSKAFAGNARWLAQLGFFVVMPTRIGYGQAGGGDVENSGDCQRKNYPPGYQAAAEQTIQVLAHVRSRTDVDPERTVVWGQSYGGTTAVAVAAKNPTGVQAFINFAGGGGGNPETQPMRPCGTPLLERMFAGYGKTAWKPRVTQFLQAHGFADMQWDKLKSAQGALSTAENLLNEAFRENYLSSGFASISDIAGPPGLNENCRKRYEEWLKTPIPRGFAVAGDGGCGFSSGTKPLSADLPTDPAERALIVCQRVRDRSCRLYAIDDQVVWTK